MNSPSIVDEAYRAGAPDTVVDLSNVTRSTALGGRGECCSRTGGGAHLSRLEAVIEQWAVQFGETPAVVVVADESLRHRLCLEDDKRTFAEWKRRGVIRVVRYADPEILELAEQLDASVLSRDQFKSFRRSHDWMSAQPHRFVYWTPEPSGIRLHRDLPAVLDADLSRAEENDEFRDRNVSADAIELIVGNHWRCTRSDCLAHRLSPERLMMLPNFSAGRVSCPSCSSPLENLGPTARQIGIKILDNGTLLSELLLADGEDVCLGRGGVGVWDVASGVANSSSISRRHLELRRTGAAIQVRDAGSTNGSRVNRWDPASRSMVFDRHLTTEWETLGRGVSIEIARTTTVRLSGRRWPLPSTRTPPPSADAEQTRLL